MPDCVKIKQLHVKLTSTAAIEIKLLTAFHRSVNSVITPALDSGARRMIHGKIEFIASLEFQAADIFDVRRLARPVESNENCQPDRYLSCGDRNNKEDEHLRVIIRQAC